MRDLVRRFGPLLGLIVVWCAFAAAAGAPFTSLANQRMMLLQTAVVGTAAVGATFVIVAGGIDLAVGSAIAATGVLAALALDAEYGPTLSALVALCLGALLGTLAAALVNGLLLSALGIVLGAGCTWYGVNSGVLWIALAGPLLALAIAALDRRLALRVPLSPFIATLALWGAVRGLAKGMHDNQPAYAERFGWIDGLMQPAPSGFGHWFPPGVLVWLGCAALGAFALRRTVLGRHVVAVGSNEETARLCGVDLARTRWAVYALAGVCAALAGLLQLSYVHMGDPTTAGGYELRVIAAVVIGGASLAGGQGSVGGAVIGALLMTVVDNGCTKLGLDNWVQELATGAIIAIAVALDRWRGRDAR
ncbi:MAG: ABC transporter permease [Planctomycetota bacterium]|nr:MAG: ABC transporter permease [Planctomycetota bacterium]